MKTLKMTIEIPIKDKWLEMRSLKDQIYIIKNSYADTTSWWQGEISTEVVETKCRKKS